MQTIRHTNKLSVYFYVSLFLSKKADIICVQV